MQWKGNIRNKYRKVRMDRDNSECALTGTYIQIIIVRDNNGKKHWTNLLGNHKTRKYCNWPDEL